MIENRELSIACNEIGADLDTVESLLRTTLRKQNITRERIEELLSEALEYLILARESLDYLAREHCYNNAPLFGYDDGECVITYHE